MTQINLNTKQALYVARKAEQHGIELDEATGRSPAGRHRKESERGTRPHWMRWRQYTGQSGG